MLKSAIVPLAVCLGIGVTAVLAHEGATGAVAERMKTMKSMGREMKTLSEMLKTPETYDRERAVDAAQAVWSHAENIPELFPEGSNKRPSEASPAIWDEWDDFVSQAKDLQDAAVEFEAAVGAGAEPAALAPGFDAMAKNCLSCHEDFRLPG